MSDAVSVNKRSRTCRKACELRQPGWNQTVREALENLLTDHSRRDLPVVFDFDNTIVYGDIGEAVLAVLTRTGKLQAKRIPATLAPSFRKSEREINLPSCVDITDYYEALLDCTGHGDSDPTPLANGYAWAVEVMQSLSPEVIVDATRTAFSLGKPGVRRMIEVTPGKTAYPAPYFYPEIVELIGELTRLGFQVWIVSASNVWSVRWMVLNGLNPLLRKHASSTPLRPEQVIGVSTLMADTSSRLWKDPVLTQTSRGYALQQPGALRKLHLTSRLHFPVPTYSGKVAWILDAIGRPPFLCAGDSPGDLPMLRFSENRLWIARLEKTGYQQSLLRAIQGTFPDRWLIQPVRTKPPGWVSDAATLPAEWVSETAKSLKLLSTLANSGEASVSSRPPRAKIPFK